MLRQASASGRCADTQTATAHKTRVSELHRGSLLFGPRLRVSVCLSPAHANWMNVRQRTDTVLRCAQDERYERIRVSAVLLRVVFSVRGRLRVRGRPAAL